MRFGQLFFRVFVTAQKKIQSKHKVKYDKVEISYYLFEAEKLGINAKVIMDDVLQLSKGDEIYNIWRCGTDFDGWGSLHIAGDKVYCYSMLKKAGISLPRHVVLRSGDYKNAVAFKREINAPIVIKPARDTGDGTGVFIKPESNLSILFAVNCSGAYGKQIIVEEYFEGTNYRLLYCKGQFLGASSRIPSFVVGDGIQSVSELITNLNKGRKNIGDIEPYGPSNRPILYKIATSRRSKRLIKKQGLTLSSIPDEGIMVRLQDICHWLYGGQYYDVTDIISPELIELGRKAAQAVGIKLAGVDLIAKDIKDPKIGSFVFNEVNTTPAILIHYEVQNRDKMRPVAREILKIMFGLE